MGKTIKELQTFIEACDFISDKEDWVPTPNQWKKIKDMIMNLEESTNPAIQQHIPRLTPGTPPNVGTPPIASAPVSLFAIPQHLQSGIDAQLSGAVSPIASGDGLLTGNFK